MCCGGKSYSDYTNSIWGNDYAPEKPEERKDMTPLTCCSDWKKYEDINLAEYRYELLQHSHIIFHTPVNEVWERVYRSHSAGGAVGW